MIDATTQNRTEQDWKSTGFERLRRAAGHQLAGIRHGLQNDSALRQVTVVFAALLPVAIFLPVSTIERLLLILSLMQVAVFEYLNSAIESCIDRISLEKHPLSRQAKDYAGAVLMAGLFWLVIAGPLVLHGLARVVR
jgi:diacylglycerol kinase (ATP)